MGSFVQLFRRLRPLVRTPSENPINRAHGRFLPRRAPPLYLMPVRSGSCADTYLRAAFRYPLRRSDLRDLAEPSGLPSTILGSTALMGFQIFVSALRRFAPADGRPLHFCSEPGPRVRCRRSIIRGPICFRRADPPARSPVRDQVNQKGRDDLRGSGTRGFDGLLGFVAPVCGPFPRRCVRWSLP